MCKADFNQDNCRSRFCEDCRSRKNRSAREDFYLERKQRRGENILLASASVSSNGYKTYTVRKNDTLGEIAESFGVSISSLRSLNRISGSTIVVGQVLKISKHFFRNNHHYH